ncbi:DNA-directed RNA polymerase subunit K [Candidatus Woesearchaeota archaeon]|nr:DNA-directed RNA polymerase subunit K [Candidatus Woesearchaeota archaeon]MBW3017760.1 DNA-directed RNA polymerase subunit K [Candidatus Woesearchaeota archaeon]
MVAAKREEAKEKFTKYERARIIGSRALQISMGAPFKIPLTKEELEKINYDPIQIAKREFDAGVVPMTVVRPLPKKVEEEEEEENK